MNAGNWFARAEKKLERAGIGTARLDALILLEDELGKDRSWLLAHPETPLQGRALQRLERKIKLRQRYKPLAYIRGFTEFYGRKFIVNKHVLEPRPESETMVDLLKNLLYHNSGISEERPLKIVDVGTGSGALAITAKLEIPAAEVIATDIDPKCLSVARRNAKGYNAKIEFLRGDLLEPLLPYILHSPFFILLCNLPYVPRNWRINQAAAMEPRSAIDGGSDGLDVYRRLFDQFKGLLSKPRYVLTEAMPPQHKQLAKIAKAAGYQLKAAQDFIQLFIRD